MKNSLSILIILTIIFSSCQKEVNMEIPSQPPRLGIHAIWNKDTVLEVQVSRSFSIKETPSFDDRTDPPTVLNKRRKYGVVDAIVRVYKNEVLYDELVFDPQTYTYKTTSGKTATPDASYHITVSAPGFADVSAPVTHFPAQVPIKSLTVRKQVANDGVGGTIDEVTVEFDDPASQKNYYWINIQRNPRNTSTHFHYFPVYVTPVNTDIIVPSGFDITTDIPTIQGDRILLKDDDFNGQTKKVTIRMSSWVLAQAGTFEQITLSLNNSSEDLFKYIRSRVLDVDNPFSTPVQAYSNMANGLGIFGLYTGDKRELE